MFQDSRAMDRERTVGSFKEAYQRYQASAEQWFDGTIQSVDRRLTATNRLLHSCRATTARFSVSDAQGFLKAADALRADQRALEGMREDLLGTSQREPMTGPPGWQKRAGNWYPGDESIYAPGNRPNDFSSRQEWQNNSNLRGYLGEQAEAHPQQDYAVPSLEHDMTQGDTYRPQPKSLGQQDPRDFSGTGQYPATPASGSGSNPYRAPHLMGPATASRLASADARWVALESAKFASANTDAYDDSHELATRAHNHAAMVTSTYDPRRSFEVSRAFVAAVVDIGRRNHVPEAPTRVASAEPTVPDSAMWL